MGMERNVEQVARETSHRDDSWTRKLIGRADGQPFLNSYAAKLCARELGQGYCVIRLREGRDGVPRFAVGRHDEIPGLGLGGNAQRLADGGQVGEGFGDRESGQRPYTNGNPLTDVDRRKTGGWDAVIDGLKKAKDVISDAWSEDPQGREIPAENHPWNCSCTSQPGQRDFDGRKEHVFDWKLGMWRDLPEKICTYDCNCAGGKQGDSKDFQVKRSAGFGPEADCRGQETFEDHTQFKNPPPKFNTLKFDPESKWDRYNPVNDIPPDLIDSVRSHLK